jgi:hypothetical protein
MRWWWRMNGTTVGLRISSRYLCVQIAINKMQFCSLTVAYVCPHHIPTSTMGHCLQHWYQQTARPYCHLPETVENGINLWGAHISSMPVAIDSEHLPTEVCYIAKLRSGQDTSEDNEHADKLPWDCFEHCRNDFVVQTHSFISCLGGWSHDPTGEEARCVGPGLAWLHVVCGCEAIWTYCQIFSNDFRGRLWWRNEHSIIWQPLWWTILQSAFQLHCPSTWDICGILLWQLYIWLSPAQGAPL